MPENLIGEGSPEEKPEPQYGVESFEKKKTEFFTRIGLGVRNAFEMHKEAGLWDWDIELDRSWKNVSEHCLVEAARADVFAEKLGLSEDLRKDLTIAAALHDFYKRQEIKIYDTEGMTWSSYEKAEGKASKLLKKRGISDRIIKLVDSVGIIALSDMENILRKENISQEDLVCLVLHYIDDYTSGSSWVNASEVTEDGIRVNDLDRRLHGVESKYKSLVEDGKSHFDGESPIDVAIRVDHRIEKIITDILKEKGGINIFPEDLPNLMDQEIRIKIEAQN